MTDATTPSIPLADWIEGLSMRLDQEGRWKVAEKAMATADLLRQQHAALVKAKETLKAWHGDDLWDIYNEQSTEMTVINAAIKAAEDQS